MGRKTNTTALGAECIIHISDWSFSEGRERGAASRQFATDELITSLNNNWAKVANQDRGSQVELVHTNCL
jgi:hypothetical protein